MRRFGGVLLAAAAALFAWPALATEAPVREAPVAVSLPGWTGLYVGASLGEREVESDWNTTCVGGTAACPLNGLNPFFLANNNPESFDFDVVRRAFYAGFNWQASRNLVLGIEGDVVWGGEKKIIRGIPGTLGTGLNPNPGDSSSVEANREASLRARVGYLVTPALMLFGTAGTSWIDLEASASCTRPPFPAGTTSWCALAANRGTTRTVTTTEQGWTAGAGFEHMLTPNLLARAEYRYAEYETFGATFFSGADIVTFDVKTRTHAAMAGIALKFSSGGAGAR